MVYDVIDDEVIILDPEVRTTISFIEEYLWKAKPRIDVIRYDTDPTQKIKIKEEIKLIASEEGYYDVAGYSSFASQVMPLRWVKAVVKPSEKRFFCSDAVTHVLHNVGIKVSEYDNDFTAPADLILYSLKNQKKCNIFTLKKRGEILE
jgi:hypothetical protein